MSLGYCIHMDDTILQLLDTPLSAQVLISTILGTQMPLLVAWVARYVKSPVLKGIIVVASSLAVGFLVCWSLGLLNWQNIVLSLLIIWFATQLAYQKFWKGTTLTQKIEGESYDPKHDMEPFDWKPGSSQ